MRIAFMGSPDFAVPALRALHHAGHDIAAVYCQPARPAGRGQAVRRCPVHVAADDLGLPVRTPARLRNDAGGPGSIRRARSRCRRRRRLWPDPAPGDAGCPEARLPQHPCQSVAALARRRADPGLPSWLATPKPASPSCRWKQVSIPAPCCCARVVPITPETTTANLHDTLAAIGAKLILDALDPHLPPNRRPKPTRPMRRSCPVKMAGSTGANRPNSSTARYARSTHGPAHSPHFAGNPLKILAAKPASGSGPPGTVLDDALCVACGLARHQADQSPAPRPNRPRRRRLSCAATPSRRAP